MRIASLLEPLYPESKEEPERRQRYSADHKLQLVVAAMQPGMTVSAVARLHGISPSLPAVKAR